MTLPSDPISMKPDSILDFSGYLIKVSSLYADFQTLFRHFEDSIKDESKYFSPEIMALYRQTSVYYVLLNDSEIGLDSLILDAKNRQWIGGRLSFKPILVFRQHLAEGYEISSIQYDDNSVIKIGNQMLNSSSILNPCIRYLKNSQDNLAKTISEEFRTILQESNKKLFHPSKSSECLEVEILQPGQDWLKCCIDLHLSLRIYQTQNLKPVHQIIYSEDSYKASPTLILQLGNETLTVDSLCTSIAKSFRVFEKDYISEFLSYPNCPVLEKDEIQSLRQQSGVLLVKQDSDSRGLPCKLLDLESGDWLDGEVAFELSAYFSPHNPENRIQDSISTVSETFPSPLDDIRQSMNPSPE